jgi:putative zinc finger/helix-turn-helix YgiT family protein
MNTKCYECGKLMKEKTVTHHYTECGLQNVYLEGVLEFTCEHCGNSFVDIPEPTELHIVLSTALSNRPERLIGPEIRFLRKEVGMTQKSFASFIGVDPVTLSRWEKDKGDANKEESNDRLIRLAFKVMMCERLQTLVNCIEDQMKKAQIFNFKKHRLDIHAEAMKYMSFPKSLESPCSCKL